MVGTRKHKVLTALSDVSAIPSTDDLSSGIMALSRQWKCLVGVTDEEFRPAGLLKRPVVGRGVLTERDRAILMKTECRKSQDQETLAAGNFILFSFNHNAILCNHCDWSLASLYSLYIIHCSFPVTYYLLVSFMQLECTESE